MINFFANIFGYILKILFDLTGNFGVSIILFTIITKLLLLPLLIKQQKSTKQLAKVQPKLLEIQEKYKDDKERYAQEYTKLQQEEHFNPFTGCLIAIIQIPIILAMFYIVSKPLTYVEKMPQETINAYVEELQIDQNTARAYPEIEIIKRKPELNIDLNLFGTVLPTMVFADVMAQQKEGAIVNFSSESALRPLTRVVGYGAAKAAISNLTKYLAGELAIKFGEGLRVNAIAPGFFLTEQNRTLMTNPDGSYTPRSEKILAHTPMGRFGTPDDLTGTLLWLCDEGASGFVNGVVVPVDGGFAAYSGV